MIRELVDRIIDEQSDNTDKIHSANRLVNFSKYPTELWPIASMEQVYKYVWTNTDPTMSAFLIVSLGEYSVKTTDFEATKVLERINQLPISKELHDITQKYLA